YNTVRTYVFSLASELKFRRRQNFLEGPNAWFVHTTLKHFLKTRDTSTLTFRRPITIDMLPLILKNSDMGNFTSRSMVTMIVIGVFGRFRIGEICGRIEGKHNSFIRNRDLILSEEGIKKLHYGTPEPTKKTKES